jgi:hypothetical protein
MIGSWLWNISVVMFQAAKFSLVCFSGIRRLVLFSASCKDDDWKNQTCRKDGKKFRRLLAGISQLARQYWNRNEGPGELCRPMG